MERNIDRHTLTFGKGLTTSPNDMVCSDNEASIMIGLTVQDGSLVPIQSPVKIGTIPYKIMYVHKGADYENIIAYDDETIYYYKRNADGTISAVQNSFSVGEVSDVKSIGNTLICATSTGLHYLLYKGGAYKNLGNELPKPDVRFDLVRTSYNKFNTGSYIHAAVFAGYKSLQYWVDADGNVCKIERFNSKLYGGEAYETKVTDKDVVGESKKYLGFYMKYSKEDTKDYDSMQTAIQGHIAEKLSRIKKANEFAFPFFVRFALQLHDGSYARISEPIILYPSVRSNFKISPMEFRVGASSDNLGTQYYFGDNGGDCEGFAWDAYVYDLWVKASINNISDWNDVVKRVVVFASDDVMPFSVDGEYDFFYPDTTQNMVYQDDFTSSSGYTSYKFSPNFACTHILPVERKGDKEIINDILSKTQFYKLFEIDSNSEYLDGVYRNATSLIAKGTVENLTVQTQLKVDDYYGWTTMSASKLYTYNQRINAFGISRKPWKGFNVFTSVSDSIDGASGNINCKFYVRIKSSSMNTWVESDSVRLNEKAINGWFYYPDTNATTVMIVNTETGEGITKDLKPHSMLNGSYTFDELPSESAVTWGGVTIPIIDSSAAERLDSQIYTSVVNNPFVFEASGDNTVGTGTILGITANTEAVSQGQFGQYPLLVFTTEGIYGMEVSSEGLYSNIYPISREVCNNADSITPTDKLVFFTSDKGLMAVSGGTCQCVSGNLSGNINVIQMLLGINFFEVIKSCKVAYDYKSSLLYIGNDYLSFVYNMKEGVFSTVDSGFENVVNDYPDNLIQKDSTVYSYSLIPNRYEDTRSYEAALYSRPVKLGGSTLLKSIRSIKHLFYMQNGTFDFLLNVSNDTDVIFKGIQKYSVGGKPWKYFLFSYSFANMQASDYFTCTIVETQMRRNDKLR